MEDKKIIELYLQQDENAIKETNLKYGGYIYSIVSNILTSKECIEEAIQDTYLTIWYQVPKKMPKKLRMFIGEIAFRRTIDIYRKEQSSKALIEEIKDAELFIGLNFTKEEVDNKELKLIINKYLKSIKKKYRDIFVERYFYNLKEKEQVKIHKISRKKIQYILIKTKNGLKKYLIKNGYSL